ncbi:MAG: 50S ribosomal protein L35 [Phycisphaerae bacterium]
MPKMKTHKGLRKRVRISAGGKVRHKKRNARHLMSSKTGNRCRSLRRAAALSGALAKRARAAVGKT